MGSNGGSDVVLDDAEIAHFRDVVRALSSYRECIGEPFLQRRSREFQLLAKTRPQSASLFEGEFAAYLANAKDCIETNDAFLRQVVAADPMYDYVANKNDLSSAAAASDKESERRSNFVPPQDLDKTRSTLRQLVRDWSNEGEEERAQCYGPLLTAVEDHYKSSLSLAQDDSLQTRAAFRVLCPGSGLGRLPFEFVRRGFSAQGNEFSYFMLLVGNYLLNHSSEVDCWSIYPFVTQVSNTMRWDDSIRSVPLPDVVPGIELTRIFSDGAAHPPEFGMCAGEFLDVYASQQSSFDAVVTPFFIDTAHDVVEYISVIYSTLRSGGVWANLGPLLWHYEDIPSERSIELPWEAVKKAILATGFEITTEERRSCTYAANSCSMMRTVYDCVFFIAIKPS